MPHLVHRFAIMPCIAIGCILAIALTGCNATITTTHGTTSTQTTPALVPPTNCGSDFDQYDQEVHQSSPTYVSYYDAPHGTYPGIAFPPYTREMPNDAAGTEGIALCSAGTGASIRAFMTAQFNRAGWHLVTDNMYCVFPTCWQSPTAPNSKYVESWDIGDSNLWALAHHNPNE